MGSLYNFNLTQEDYLKLCELQDLINQIGESVLLHVLLYTIIEAYCKFYMED